MPAHPPFSLTGVVVSAGKMMKAVKVRTAHQTYNSFLRKNFRTFKSHLVSDPASSLRTGDIVRITSGWRTSRHIKHVVTAILAPYGVPLSERPPVMSEEERLQEKRVKREAKLQRRELRRLRGGEEVGEEGGKGVEEEGGRRDGMHDVGDVDERAGRMRVKADREGEKALRYEEEAEGVQERLDREGVGAEEVERRVEGLKL